MDSSERRTIAERRLRNILGKYVVASSRTLEQKISDAGPFNQRIDPHILTPARRDMMIEGIIKMTDSGKNRWYYLADTDDRLIQQKLAHLIEIHDLANDKNLTMRVGQALEISVYRTLQAQNELGYFGRFENINAEDDSTLYTKTEPPNTLSSNKISGKQSLDFLVYKNDIYGGVEVKNTREWLYPDRKEIRDVLRKCAQLDVVPILIGRRIPFVTFKLLNSCGAIIHETYRQRYPASEEGLVKNLKDKNLFGYHDLALGNGPDPRLTKFIHANLPKIIEPMKERFDEFKDLVLEYGRGDITYKIFAAKVRRRTNGTNEDGDWDT